MTVTELIEALSALEPGLTVVADDGDGGLVPIDQAIPTVITEFPNLPDGDYIVLRPLEDWMLMDHPDEDE